MADRRRLAMAPTLAFRGETYPRRGQFFAHRFQRLLAKTCASHEIGCDGFALLVIVSMTEDSRRYRKPPAFWNSQLQSYLGLSYKQLDTARKACIDAGWLHYEPGGKSKAGIYWVVVPPCFDDFDDSPLGENNPAANCSTDPLPTGQLSGIDQEEEREAIRREKGESFLPVPNPNSPTPVPGKPGPAAAERILWKLEEVGVDLSVETLEESLALGLSLDSIEAVVDYARSRPKAWGGGAVRRRLTSRSARRHAPHEGWPPPAPAAREAELQKRTAADSVAAQKTREEASGRRAELQQLEMDFGPQLDALPDDSVFGMLEELKIDPRFVRRTAKGRAPASLPTVRPQLLRALAARVGIQN